MSLETDKKTNLVWLDMEMTGLNPDVDAILEVAVVITDADLNVLEEGPNYAIHQSDELLAKMDNWNKKHHGQSGLIDRVRSSTISVSKAERDILKLVKKYCMANKVPLCGNSIEQDRRFIRKYMPRLDKFLHYRHVNVSSFKEMIARWYPDHKEKDFAKKKAHLALDDVYESIAELKHIREHFFIS